MSTLPVTEETETVLEPIVLLENKRGSVPEFKLWTILICLLLLFGTIGIQTLSGLHPQITMHSDVWVPLDRYEGSVNS